MNNKDLVCKETQVEDLLDDIESKKALLTDIINDLEDDDLTEERKEYLEDLYFDTEKELHELEVMYEKIYN